MSCPKKKNRKKKMTSCDLWGQFTGFFLSPLKLIPESSEWESLKEKRGILSQANLIQRFPGLFRKGWSSQLSVKNYGNIPLGVC